MENIIQILAPLVLILAILLPWLWRSKSAARSESRAAEPKKQAGLLDAINRKLEELAAAERSQSANDPDDDDDNPWSRDDEPETEEAETKAKTKAASPSRPESEKTAAIAAPPVSQNRNEPETPRKNTPVKTPAPRLPDPAVGTRISRDELRRAVVWSEILGPPIALRKPEP